MSIHDPAFPMYFENNHSVQIAGGLSKLELISTMLLVRSFGVYDSAEERQYKIKSAIQLSTELLKACKPKENTK